MRDSNLRQGSGVPKRAYDLEATACRRHEVEQCGPRAGMRSGGTEIADNDFEIALTLSVLSH